MKPAPPPSGTDGSPGDVDWTGFQISDRRSDGRRVLEVAGNLDQTSSPQLRRSLRAVLADRPTELCVVLARVPFVDPSGIAALAGGYKQAVAQGCRFTLRCPNGATRRALAVSHLADIVPVRP